MSAKIHKNLTTFLEMQFLTSAAILYLSCMLLESWIRIFKRKWNSSAERDGNLANWSTKVYFGFWFFNDRWFVIKLEQINYLAHLWVVEIIDLNYKIRSNAISYLEYFGNSHMFFQVTGELGAKATDLITNYFNTCNISILLWTN